MRNEALKSNECLLYRMKKYCMHKWVDHELAVFMCIYAAIWWQSLKTGWKPLETSNLENSNKNRYEPYMKYGETSKDSQPHDWTNNIFKFRKACKREKFTCILKIKIKFQYFILKSWIFPFIRSFLGSISWINNWTAYILGNIIIILLKFSTWKHSTALIYLHNVSLFTSDNNILFIQTQ